MTNSLLTVDRVSFVLPDGNSLFTEISCIFTRHRMGLVGRNGVGKSVLGRILAGELTPTTGTCTRSGTVYYLAQQVSDQRQHALSAEARPCAWR